MNKQTKVKEQGYNMNRVVISENVKYIGVNDQAIDLFESQYVVENGMAYNSYLILDEKIAIMDTVDARATEDWMANLEHALDGREPDYLVISHMEPDHAGNIENAIKKYPNMKLVGNAKTFQFLGQFFDLDVTDKQIVVKEGEELSLGSHTLQFIMAPMVHWPEVMVTYEQSEKILFSADAFGKFGTLDTDEDWACEARRYYFNIVGKYGVQVQALLKKAANLDIHTICPLHGPILKENLEYYIGKYQTWSSYEPEDKGILVAYASIHGNTKKAAKQIGALLEEMGAEKVVVSDLSREDMAEVIEDAFRYDRMILACATYDGGMFPVMEDFLNHLKMKGFQNRKVGLIENGTWAPMAAKKMQAALEEMKNITICENQVSIKSTVNETSLAAMMALPEEITA